MQDLRIKTANIIVFFLDKLTERQRFDILKIARGDEAVSLICLDETLLIFLCQERSPRLRSFLRLTLPSSALNPYTPFRAGDVPPEMFFGRQEMARELQDPNGSSFAYGGRQIGKSALLRKVERDFHLPERGQYARVEDIKVIGNPIQNEPIETIWTRLRVIFQEIGLISDKLRTVRPDDVIKFIVHAMDEDATRRVIIMFDEADRFLEADSKEHFYHVDKLRDLVQRTGHRVKVVFVGLESVMRYSLEPNQPLAHFGLPLLVGPLEPLSARQLVQEPLYALGYRLDDPSTALRILSYTNYHPGLIQLFCKELLTVLHAQKVEEQPPYIVTREVVEAVYRNEEVRHNIKERFLWTLALRDRYQAVAWVLVIDQMDIQESYSRSYRAAEIFGLVRQFWPDGFREGELNDFRGVLDELEGLGVLVKNEGYYRLRNPNLVRLMGTTEDIFKDLDELAKKQPTPERSSDSFRIFLDRDKDLYSPLTCSQERRLNPTRSGVGLIFASHALSLSLLPLAIKGLVVGRNADSGGYRELTDIENAEGLGRVLTAKWKSDRNLQCLVFSVQPTGLSSSALGELVKVALKFCETRQSVERWLRVLFLFDPDASAAWFNLDPAVRDDLEDRAEAVISPLFWNKIAIEQRLAFHKHEKLHRDTDCKAVLKATGGWPYIVDELFKLCEMETDPTPVSREITRKLDDVGSELSQEFRLRLGVHYRPAESLLSLMRRIDEPIPLDDFEEYVECKSVSLSTQECRNARQYLLRLRVVIEEDEAVEVDPIVRKVWNA